MKKVNDAKKAQQDAIDKVVEAQERERDAILKVAEAQRDLNDLEREYGKLLLDRAKRQLEAFGQTALPSGTKLPQVTAPSGDGQVILPDVVQFLDSLYAGQLTDTERANINVVINAGMGTDGDDVARQIIDVLKSYERANGLIPLTVQSVYAV